ncbi:hypothetical protein E6C60_3065 [Paenibacillus algicola]|uniref:Uncharacterized protein n=1 Tax=Paenibacillus algicola TaxID=2565926 RepID=A0A4P8XLY4_9BACL|nr:hypothetical protein [Paenibacillus algicola]QCT03776.1 hypothetical protein E6C60_3065 [Paenibacillus algicola]
MKTNKTRWKLKPERCKKVAYKPGSIGPSVIATAIKDAYKDIVRKGYIPNRRERKALDRMPGRSSQKFYAQG